MQPPDDRDPVVATRMVESDDAGASRDEITEAELVDIDLAQLERDEATAGAPAAAVPPRVDPRIHARRAEVEREQDRKRVRALMAALSLVIVVGCGVLVVRSPFLDVDHIEVTGVPQARAAAIVAASGVHPHDPMLLVSTGAIARRVDGVPGIGSAQVTRHYPGTIRIHVQQLGIALWARNPKGGVVLIGYDGRVQRVAPSPPPNVIELRGLAKVPAPGGRIAIDGVTQVMSQLPTVLARRIGAVSAASSDDVRAYLIVGGEVRLGDLALLHSKGMVAEAVLERIDCAVSYVDVSSVANPVALPAPGAHCNP